MNTAQLYWFQGKISCCHNLLLNHFIIQNLFQLQKYEFCTLSVKLILKNTLESCSSLPSLKVFTLWGCWDVLGRVNYLPVFSADFSREYWTRNSKFDPLTMKKEINKLNLLKNNFDLFWSGKEFKAGLSFISFAKIKSMVLECISYHLIHGGLYQELRICIVTFSEVWSLETEAEGNEITLKIGKWIKVWCSS